MERSFKQRGQMDWFWGDFGLGNNLDSESIYIRSALGAEGWVGVGMTSHVSIILSPNIPYRSYQSFDMQTRRKVQCYIVLTN